MTKEVFDLASRTAFIAGRFPRDYQLELKWLPHFIEDFPKAMKETRLAWKSCKFIRDNRTDIPNKHGVYCFSTDLGMPLPDGMHVPLYVGKAAPGYLRSRYNNYLSEGKSVSGREKIVFMLNKYRGDLSFWWAELPRNHVEAVEEHLLMCCHPPFNSTVHSRERLWGKAFE